MAAICKKGSNKKNMLEGQSSSLHAMHTGRREGKGARKYLVYSKDVPNPICESVKIVFIHQIFFRISDKVVLHFLKHFETVSRL